MTSNELDAPSPIEQRATDQRLRDECLRYRAWKRDEVLDVLIELETAAWTRNWLGVQAARARIEELTGLHVIGPMRRELQELE